MAEKNTLSELGVNNCIELHLSLDSNCVKELVSEDEEDDKVEFSSVCNNDELYLTERQEVRRSEIFQQKEDDITTEMKLSNKTLYQGMYARELTPRAPVTVTINCGELSHSWKDSLEKGIQEIELAAPGLNFEQTTSQWADISVTMCDGVCKTSGSLRFPKQHRKNKVNIYLTEEDSLPRRTGTIIHELLHALGFEHEHKRYNGGHYLKEYSDNPATVPKQKYYKPITPFDPYSIMLYKVGHYVGQKKENRRFSENRQMSELDKIALNMLYPPSERSNYHPVQSAHGMYYCGRRTVMKTHNQPYPPLVEQCGPDSGPNCAACRVLSKPNNIDERWQGRSSYVYCGNDDCGPDVDEPCEDCLKLVGIY